ncbi:DNA cytosine methyltransferase [Rossellomorea aquimaris]|uniref:DNA cytosine methyltransferase n=1 Tax=Rossellomorea aquimaris TaxID=189382 RepID=UPI001CD27039|nr:DNA cytosine methyltransferase [Rossellomorea aquimaris]MCA1054314.1 DNA cytosine methyltransferase [Rossellomorea aquimaris]
MKKLTYKLIDLFAGAGGLSNGFEQTERFKVVGAVEINRAARETFECNHGENLILDADENGISDITKIDFLSLKSKLNLNINDTVIVGGPPCQGFSNANRQKNYLISGNNQLVKEFVRAIDEIRPIGFVMENVKTMNSDTHKFFVTKENSEKSKDYSSLKHLNEISKEEKIYSQDRIELIVSETLPKSLFVKYKTLNEVPHPIIQKKELLTRLRTFQRRYQKSNIISLKNNAEKNEVECILSELENYDSQDILVKNIISDLNKLLTELLLDPVTSEQKIQHLITFNEYNRFLTRCQELKDEEIECLKLVADYEANKYVRVEAVVYSYNVVKYLKKVFECFGYKVEPGVLDSSNYKVPQRRKRFIMMGVRSKEINIKLPEPLTDNPTTVKDAISDLEIIEPQQEFDNYNENIYVELSEASSLVKGYFREDITESLLFNHVNTNSSPLIKKRFEAIRKTNGKNFHSLSEELKSSYEDASRTQNTVYLRLNYDEPSPTVVNVRKSMWQHPTKARALSIREAARLQSFQDSFIFHGRKDEQYQQVGNAVPPLLAKAIANQLVEYLDEIQEIDSSK